MKSLFVCTLFLILNLNLAKAQVQAEGDGYDNPTNDTLLEADRSAGEFVGLGGDLGSGVVNDEQVVIIDNIEATISP